jgi:hypothetical protein
MKFPRGKIKKRQNYDRAKTKNCQQSLLETGGRGWIQTFHAIKNIFLIPKSKSVQIIKSFDEMDKM